MSEIFKIATLLSFFIPIFAIILFPQLDDWLMQKPEIVSIFLSRTLYRLAFYRVEFTKKPTFHQKRKTEIQSDLKLSESDKNDLTLPRSKKYSQNYLFRYQHCAYWIKQTGKHT